MKALVMILSFTFYAMFLVVRAHFAVNFNRKFIQKSEMKSKRSFSNKSKFICVYVYLNVNTNPYYCVARYEKSKRENIYG